MDYCFLDFIGRTSVSALFVDDVLIPNDGFWGINFISLAIPIGAVIGHYCLTRSLAAQRKEFERKEFVNNADGSDEEIRQGFGTRSFGDMIKGGWGVSFGGVDEVNSGARVQVSAFTYVEGRLRQGVLELHLPSDPPVVWRPYRIFRDWGRPITVAAPYRSVVQRAPTAWESFIAGPGRQVVGVEAADRRWEFAVMQVDAPVVLAALEKR